jgi:Luciferase
VNRDLRAELRDRLLAIEGVVESDSQFGEGMAFWVSGKEIAHFEGADEISLRLTRVVVSKERPRLKADPRVDLKRRSADWIVLRFSRREDIDFIGELAELAAAAHMPPLGAPMRPPPLGPELARRRRFH